MKNPCRPENLLRSSAILHLGSSLVLLLFATPVIAVENILPNSNFAGAAPQENVRNGWRWDPIILPSDVAVEANESITVRGREGFLTSPPVRTLRKTEYSYEISAEVSGKGSLRIEAIWWDTDSMPAAPHIEVAVPLQQLSGTPARVKGTVHPSNQASYGKVRFVQVSDEDDGILVIRSPRVEVMPRRFEPGTLLLSLDAAHPGDSPGDRWQDLTGLNQPFQVIGNPKLDRENGTYYIDSRDKYFQGAVADESRFDFDTARGTGKNEPFTLVIYSSLDGPCAGAFIHKLEPREIDEKTGAMLDVPGWMAVIRWDEFGEKGVDVHQMIDNAHARMISRHPSPDNQGFIMEPGEMQLFVIHVPGDGLAENVQVFHNGKNSPERNMPWTGGSLPKQSIANDAPLCITGCIDFFAKGNLLFNGAIGFVEIWSGRGLLEGMSPGQYGTFRWNQGSPERGLIHP
jgi:hypothetical protein